MSVEEQELYRLLDYLSSSPLFVGFVLFYSNTTGVSSRAGIIYTVGLPEFIPVACGIRVVLQ